MERRAALEEAFDKLEGGDENELEKTELEPEKVEAKVEEVEAPEKGAPDPKIASPDPKPTIGDGKPAPKKEDKALKQAAEAAASTGEGPKAPVSWKPTAKAEWAKLPLDIRQEVARREREMSQYMSQNDHHRKFTEQFAKVVQPYNHLIQAQNSTPLQAVKNMMATTAGLVLGNKQQKASIVAEIIKNYDIDIEILDHVLSGKGVPAKAGVEEPTTKVMQMLQPVYSFMDEIRQAREGSQSRRQEEADRQVDEFADTPHFEDVREDMADILEVAAKRGITLTLQQAYEKAIALNPEVSEVVAKQKAAEKAREAGTRLAKARRTASTIVGNPAGSGGGDGKPKTRREQLLDAWEDSTQH